MSDVDENTSSGRAIEARQRNTILNIDMISNEALRVLQNHMVSFPRVLLPEPEFDNGFPHITIPRNLAKVKRERRRDQVSKLYCRRAPDDSPVLEGDRA